MLVLQPVAVVVFQQLLESREDIVVGYAAGEKLPVVESLAVLKQQPYVAGNDGILRLVFRVVLYFVAQAAHQGLYHLLLFGRHVERLVDAIVEEGVMFDSLFELGAMEQVGVKQKHPSREVHQLVVVLLAAYLARSHAYQRALLIVVVATAVFQAYHLVVGAHKNAVDVVVVETMPYGRHFVVINHTDERMAVGVSDPCAVVRRIVDFQNLCHSVWGDIELIFSCKYTKKF